MPLLKDSITGAHSLYFSSRRCCPASVVRVFSLIATLFTMFSTAAVEQPRNNRRFGLWQAPLPTWMLPIPCGIDKFFKN